MRSQIVAQKNKIVASIYAPVYGCISELMMHQRYTVCVCVCWCLNVSLSHYVRHWLCTLTLTMLILQDLIKEMTSASVVLLARKEWLSLDKSRNLNVLEKLV